MENKDLNIKDLYLANRLNKNQVMDLVFIDFNELLLHKYGISEVSAELYDKLKEIINSEYNSDKPISDNKNNNSSSDKYNAKNIISDMSNNRLIRCFVRVCSRTYEDEMFDTYTTMSLYKRYIEDEFVKRGLPSSIFKNESLKSILHEASINALSINDICIPNDLSIMKITDLILVYERISAICENSIIPVKKETCIEQFKERLEEECKYRNII